MAADPLRRNTGVNSRIGRRAFLVLVLLGVLLTTTACNGGKPAEKPAEEPVAQEEPTPTPQEDALYTPQYQPNGSETAVFKTSKGDITVELYGKDAPIHVGNFVELARKGFYNDTKFHRYEPGFVIQGGDPQTRELSGKEVAAQAGQPGSRLGTGGPGYSIQGEFDPEINPNKHVDGALGMARSQSPDSAGSQFYFTLAATPFLDGQYTVFGKVTSGLDVVKQLRAGDVIESIEIDGASE